MAQEKLKKIPKFEILRINKKIVFYFIFSKFLKWWEIVKTFLADFEPSKVVISIAFYALKKNK